MEPPAPGPTASEPQKSPRRRIGRGPLLAVLIVVLFLLGGMFAGLPPAAVAGGPGDVVFTKSSGVCSGKSLVYGVEAETSGDVGILVPSPGDHSWREYRTWVEIDVLQSQACNLYGDRPGIRRAEVSLVAYDDTQAFVEGDDWIRGQVLQPESGVGISVFHADYPNAIRPDGGKALLSLQVEWHPGPHDGARFLFRLATFDAPGQSHVGDRVRFVFTIDLTISETLCAGRCWSPWADERVSEDETRAVDVVPA